MTWNRNKGTQQYMIVYREKELEELAGNEGEG
jgi:hypothetical protein